MRLFIFNSNMIVRSLFILLILFFGYNIYLVKVIPSVNFYQNQWQKNLVRAQEFIYHNSDAKKVIVGSSMSERMGEPSLPEGYYNLSFSGGSALTGLEIIKTSGAIPPDIYIETNTIFKNKDDQMIKTLFYPLWWKFKKNIPVLQEKFQPLNVVFSIVKTKFSVSHQRRFMEKRNEEIFSTQLKRRIEIDSKGIGSYQNELDELKELIEYFNFKGSRIYFFEMPIDEGLKNLKLSRQKRMIIRKNFNHPWLKFPKKYKYETTDGVHLTYKSAYNFSQLFVGQTNDTKGFK